MSCVLAVKDGISHIVQVVSMLDVIIKLGETVFQSKEVNGAVCSGDFEFERRARGVNFCIGGSLEFEDRVIELLELYCFCGGSDHRRK